MYSTDQPPAYLGNDKPPDYYDVRRHEAITPPPVDIASPNNVTAVHFPPHDDTPVDHVSPPDNATAHIPLTTTTNGTSHTVHSSNTATVNTRYPSENVIFVQPPTYNSHFYNVNEVSDNSISNGVQPDGGMFVNYNYMKYEGMVYQLLYSKYTV